MSADSRRSSTGAFAPILLGGLIAGTLDITYACVFSYVQRGTRPARILQSVASGVLGASAFTGGNKAAALGLFLHFLIATLAATVFYLTSRQLGFLTNHAVISGIVFGLCVYLVMNYVVLPLSAIPFKLTFAWPSFIGGLLIHTLGIGLPISLVTRWYSK